MELADKLATLAAHCVALKPEHDSEPPWIVVRRPKQLFGLIPYSSYAGKIFVVSIGEYWRVMLGDNQIRNDIFSFIGADFSQPDAVRDGAWRHTKETRWHPVLSDAEEQGIFQRIEDLIDLAVKNLSATQI